MGVLGLTPFLQKLCPEVIKRIPGRLNGISGKTVVIDGTLITQRLHFAPLPQRNRHVLGWYRLLNDLRRSNVSAICVFDGKERNAAKAAETLRRRNARSLSAARLQLENARLQRLHGLKKSISGFSTEDWKDVQSKFRDLVQESQHTPVIARDPVVFHDSDEVIADEIVEVAVDHVEVDLDIPDFPSTSDVDAILAEYDISLLEEAESNEDREEETLPNTLSLPYKDYLRSVSTFKALPTTPGSADPDAETEAAMSKTQLQLAVDEGLFWKSLSGEPAKIPLSDETTAAQCLTSLTERSELMFDSYRRRIDTPTVQTFDESREIIRAMGVPCFDTTGAYEAEALAASLVIKGYADYVASEDTDVLVYEAPLLRNLSNRADPLIVMSGAEIRNTLQLSRESYVDFALLLGTDFSQRIKNVGPARALKFIKEYGSIERVVENETKYPPRIPISEYLDQVALAREAFGTLPPVTPEIEQQLKITREGADSLKLRRVMRKFGLTREMSDDTNFSDALAGNYFSDNPSPL